MKPSHLLSATLVLTSTLACSAAAAADPEYTVLTKLFRVKAGTDYRTTNSTTERNQYPSNGALFYIAAAPSAGRQPLYRLYSAPHKDQMDSVVAGEGGYATQGIHGYAWSSGGNGLSPIIRLYNGIDHAPAQNGEGLPGYGVIENTGLYGYNRNKHQALNLLTQSAGGLTIASNGVAGGALWSWVWNGVEFVDTNDYGRLIQSALFYYDSQGRLHNPTEAGDRFGTPSQSAQDKSGSPILNLQITNGTHITRSIPLDFVPENFGGDGNHPVIYPQMSIGKNIQMNYAGKGAVVRYTSHVASATAIPATLFELPTAYLKPAFNRFRFVDAKTGVVTQVYPASCSNTSIQFHTDNPNFSGYGGVIASDASGQYAIGIYGRTNKVGGNIAYFDAWDFSSNGCIDATNKISAVRAGPISVGDNAWTVFMVSGTVSDVVAKMRDLYTSGAQ